MLQKGTIQNILKFINKSKTSQIIDRTLLKRETTVS